MKLGLGDAWVDISKDDINDTKNLIKKILKKLKNFFANNIPRELTIAFIDERYNITGYIISYSKIKISLNKFKKILQREKDNKQLYEITNLLNQKEYKKYVIFNSGELNGFEIDTPDNFDFYIE